MIDLDGLWTGIVVIALDGLWTGIVVIDLDGLLFGNTMISVPLEFRMLIPVILR